MRIYTCGTPVRVEPCKAFSQGTGWQLIEQPHPFYQPGDCAVWGLMRGARRVREDCKRLGYNYYAMDNAYVGRDEYYRITKNGFQNTALLDRPADRWRRLGVPLKAWRSKGKHILVCESSPYC